MLRGGPTRSGGVLVPDHGNLNGSTAECNRRGCGKTFIRVRRVPPAELAPGVGKKWARFEHFAAVGAKGLHRSSAQRVNDHGRRIGTGWGRRIAAPATRLEKLSENKDGRTHRLFHSLKRAATSPAAR